MASSEHELVVKVIPDMSEVDAEVARRQQPSVGRIVHYVSHGSPVQPDGTQAYTSQCRAAVVAEVYPNHRCMLAIINPTGLFFHDTAQDEASHAGGTWHWPERV